MTLPRFVPAGLAIGLALSAVLIDDRSAASPALVSSAPSAAVAPRAVPVVAFAETVRASRAAERYPLDNVDQLCAYSHAEFSEAVPPAAIREYEETFGIEVVVGTSESNFLLGTPGDDLILGFAGVDRIIAQGGDDQICGGPGADRIYGGSGNDRIVDRSGSDDVHP